jgi:hypothetical protein
MEMNTLKDMVLGKPAPLVSTFRLSYYSILNLMSRAEGQFTAEHVIRNSFHQFQYEKVSVKSLTSLCACPDFMKCSITHRSLSLSGFTRHRGKGFKTGRGSCCSRCIRRGNHFPLFLKTFFLSLALSLEII